MPSGAKKRKAAKKKKTHDSSTTHGENDGGELGSRVSPENQDPTTAEAAVEVVKREDSSSKNKSVSIQKDANEEEGNIEIDIASKPNKSNDSNSSSSSSGSDDEAHVVEKKVVVVESVEAIESLPEKITQKAEDLEASTVVDPVKPVDSSLEVQQACEDTKNDKNNEKNGLVVEEQTFVVDEIASKDDCSSSSVAVESVSKENGVVELPLSDEKAYLESKDHVASSTAPTGSISGVNGADCADETEAIECSDRQPLVASTPLAVQKMTSWKNCCGILDLFSGSNR